METNSNLISFINQQLTKLSFPPLQLENTEKDILNCIYSLLQQRHKDIIYSAELQHSINISNTENDQLNSTIEKSNQKYQQATREIKILTNSLSISDEKLKLVTEKFAQVRDELKQTKTNLLFQKTQFQHDIRKKSRDLEKMRERINKIVNEKSVKNGITLVNPLSKSMSIKHDKKTENSDEKMYNIVVSNYEQREKEILSENHILRQFILEMYHGLEKNLQTDAEIPDALALKEAYFEMPFEMAKPTIETRVHWVLEKLDEKYKNLNAVSENISSKIALAEHDQVKLELEKFKNLCEIQKQSLDEQNQLIELAMAKDSRTLNQDAIINDSSMAEIDKQKQEIEFARKSLDQERKLFTEAAVRMGIERAHLQKEKEDLEERFRQQETEKLLNQMPATPFWMKKGAPISESVENSPLKNRMEGPITRSTPKSFENYGLEDSISQINLQSRDILVESDTLNVSPKNLNNLWNSKELLKSALKKSNTPKQRSVRIQESI